MVSRFKVAGLLASMLAACSALGSDAWLQEVGPRLQLPGPAPVQMAPGSEMSGTTVTTIDGLTYRCTFEMVNLPGQKPYWGFRTCTITAGSRRMTVQSGAAMPGLPEDRGEPLPPGESGMQKSSGFVRDGYRYGYAYDWQLQGAQPDWHTPEIVEISQRDPLPPVQP